MKQLIKPLGLAAGLLLAGDALGEEDLFPRPLVGGGCVYPALAPQGWRLAGYAKSTSLDSEEVVGAHFFKHDADGTHGLGVMVRVVTTAGAASEIERAATSGPGRRLPDLDTPGMRAMTGEDGEIAFRAPDDTAFMACSEEAGRCRLASQAMRPRYDLEISLDWVEHHRTRALIAEAAGLLLEVTRDCPGVMQAGAN